MNLEGKVALVTGGSSGLGAAIVDRLRTDGADVVVADLAGDPPVDVRDDAAVAELIERIDADHGRLDILVCSAAVETRASAVDCTDEDWERVIDTNLTGVFHCLRHAVPVMARSGGGSVVLMGSILGMIGTPGYAAYCASKGALNNLAKQVAIEHAADGIRVNVVAPSATDTGLFMQLIAQAPDPDAIIEMVAGRTPMQRLGRADEVAGTVAFLCSPEAAYISGAIIPLDGGMAARRIL
jgi:NAD(P)-dependent dehydrogenase (short-subunit alcohol dehydrogenase family)